MINSKHTLTRNPHRLDEMPKNTPSKYILFRCPKAEWIQEPGFCQGHRVKNYGHRIVSGIVRQKEKEEIRKEIADTALEVSP